jgi:hypothetical protein
MPIGPSKQIRSNKAVTARTMPTPPALPPVDTQFRTRYPEIADYFDRLDMYFRDRAQYDQRRLETLEQRVSDLEGSA